MYFILIACLRLVAGTCFTSSYNCITSYSCIEIAFVFQMVLQYTSILMQVQLTQQHRWLTVFLPESSEKRIFLFIAKHIIDGQLKSYTQKFCIWFGPG